MSSVSALLGAGAALATDVAVRRTPSRRRLAWGLGLVGAAAIYPLGRPRSAGTAIEVGTLAVATGVAAAALVLPADRGRSLLAAGWLAHAGFDAAFHARAGSRIPSWYPAMCAGYDGAAAALLLRA